MKIVTTHVQEVTISEEDLFKLIEEAVKKKVSSKTIKCVTMPSYSGDDRNITKADANRHTCIVVHFHTDKRTSKDL